MSHLVGDQTQPPSPAQQQSLETRVALTESNIKTLVSTVDSLSQAVARSHKDMQEQMRTMENSMVEGQKTLFKRIEDFQHNIYNGSKVNWGWLLSAVILLGAVIGLYVTPVSQDIKEVSVDFSTYEKAAVQRAIAAAEQRGRSDKARENHTRWLEQLTQTNNDTHKRLGNTEGDVKKIQGTIDALTRQVDAIDSGRSRAWNKLSNPE